MPYTYESLDQNSKQIRLVTVVPGSQSSPLRCSIQVVSLHAKPDYEALSYEWGPPTGVREVLLDEGPLPVRENLYLALLYLRSPKTSQTFWIDAICIDQTDILERNSQVEMMGDIYRNANIVRAWLGPESSTSAEAFKLLHRLKRAGGMDSKRAHRLSGNDSANLSEFANRTYWRRVWIVQELVLAKEIVFHCGHEDVVWWPSLLTSLRIVGFLHSPAGLILSLRDRRRTNSLLILMRNCYSAQATDIRDKVYALLGIADDMPMDAIRVDYTIAVEDLKDQVDKMYRSKEIKSAPLLWSSLGGSTTVGGSLDMDLGFSRYLNTYFHHPQIFSRIEETRVLATSTSYGTSVVKEKLRSLLIELESIEEVSNAKRVDSGIEIND